MVINKFEVVLGLKKGDKIICYKNTDDGRFIKGE